MLNLEPISVYVPLALALHVFVAWHVWHARREAQDAMDYVTGTGPYEKDGGLAGDIMVLVNERLAGGAVGAAGELISPVLRHIAGKLEASFTDKPTPPAQEGELAEKEPAPQKPAIIAPQKAQVKKNAP